MGAIDLIIFDCDGVLIDSEILSADVLIDELAKIGVVIDRAYVRRHFLGRSFPTVAQTLRDGHAPDLPDDFETRYRSALLRRFETDLRTTRGIEAVLEALTLPVCVATSSSPPRVRRSLEITGLARFFGEHVFTASQVAKGKPEPDLFLFAASQMGVPPHRTLVIEDSMPGLIGACASGARVLAYCGGGHMAGHVDESSLPAPAFSSWTDFPAILADLTERCPL